MFLYCFQIQLNSLVATLIIHILLARSLAFLYHFPQPSWCSPYLQNKLLALRVLLGSGPDSRRDQTKTFRLKVTIVTISFSSKPCWSFAIVFCHRKNDAILIFKIYNNYIFLCAGIVRPYNIYKIEIINYAPYINWIFLSIIFSSLIIL